MTQTWVSSFHRAGSVNTPLAISTVSPLAAAIQNAIYGFSMIATGGFPPYAWSLSSQTGTNGWLISSQGTVNGIPPNVETDVLTLKVTDSSGTSVTGNFSVSVQPQPQAALPTFSPPAGSYAATQFVIISCATAGSSCYYTTDGSTPTFPISGTTQKYTQGLAGLIVNTSQTLKAIGVASGFTNSAVASAAYVIGAGIVYNYYVGPRAGIDANPLGVPNGLDTNPGTLAAPFAITSFRKGASGGVTTSPNFSKFDGQGVNVGFLPGIYDASALMYNGDPISGGLQFPGGNASKPNFYSSVDVNGNYSPRTATFDGRGASHIYGAGLSTGAQSWDGPIIAHTGVGPGSQNYTLGFITIDGFRFTGHSLEGLRYGGASFGGPAVIVNPAICQNCEFFYRGFNFNGGVTGYSLTNGGGGFLPASGTQTYFNVPLGGGAGSLASADVTVTNGVIVAIGAQSAAPNFANAGMNYAVGNTLTPLNSSQSPNSTLPPGGSGCVITVTAINGTTMSSDNGSDMWIDHNTNACIHQNNWHHDNFPHIPGSIDHNNAVIFWGNSGTSTGTIIRYNTMKHAGNILGKELGISGSQVYSNYVDVSDMTVQCAGIQDMTGNSTTSTPSLSLQTTIANNIVIVWAGGAGSLDCLGGIGVDTFLFWNTPILRRNNLVINAGNKGGAIVSMMVANPGTNAVGQLQDLNNIYHNPGGGTGNDPVGGRISNFLANPTAIKAMDFNMHPAGSIWWVTSNSAPTTGSSNSQFTTVASFAAAITSGGGISGVGLHDISGVPTFVGTGLYAAQYKLAIGSLGKNAGSDGTDMGPWGGTDVLTNLPPVKIGCDFAVNL